jgi:hypothetical protein
VRDCEVRASGDIMVHTRHTLGRLKSHERGSRLVLGIVQVGFRYIWDDRDILKRHLHWGVLGKSGRLGLVRWTGGMFPTPFIVVGMLVDVRICRIGSRVANGGRR